MNKALGGILGVVTLTGAVLLAVWDYNNTEYKCPVCDAQHHPSVGKYVFGPHVPTHRYLKCPTCGIRGWHKRVMTGMGPN